MSDLSEEQKKNLSLVEMKGIRFSQTAAIQPIAITECAQWGEPWAGADGTVHNKQTYKRGQLLDKNGEPYTEERLKQMAVRPIGSLPVEMDYDALYAPEENTYTESESASISQQKPSLWQRLFGRK